MLSQVQQEKTPLTRQLDQLTVLLTLMAAAALALVVVLGLIRGDDFDELFLIGISLAIAAIPTGLPAVVTTVLSPLFCRTARLSLRGRGTLTVHRDPPSTVAPRATTCDCYRRRLHAKGA
jgi:P-type Ca2+ transporter type 2C